MIELKHLNGAVFYVNPHLIESIEAVPDTTITFLSSRRVVVANPLCEVLNKIAQYRKCLSPII